MKGLVVRYILRYTRRILSDSHQADMRWPTIDEVALATGVSDIDVAGTTWLSEHKFPMLSGVEHSLADFQRALDDRIAATDELDHLEYLTPERISGEFQLNDMEIVLLCAIAAPQTDNDILRLYQFATGMDSTLFPGFFYAELLANENYAPDDILTLLTPTHPLRLYSLIEAGAHSEWGKSTPPSLAPLSVPNRIISFLLGSDSGVDMDYARCIPATPAPAPETADDAPPPDQNPLVFEGDFERQTVKRLKHRKARILFIGPKGFGRRSFIQKYAAQSHVSAIEINLSKISGDETPHHLMTTAGLWFREARLQQAIMIFRCDEAPDAEAETVMLKIASKFRDMADRYPGTICLLAQARLPLFAQWFGDCAEVLCPLPARASQMHMWQTALKPYAAPNRIDKIAAYVSTSYRLTMGEIKQTIAACRAQNAGKAINGPQLAETLRLTRGQELIGLAELKATPLGLSDIVLSEKVSSVIGEILNYARYSEFVSDEWGFSKMSRATGLSVLFAGPPGTGKTLTAGVLAHELKRAFYVVDISRVVDKYIGETEKKLAKIFDHAQKSQAILLFDEADSLFAKRTAVKSSNDRYANLEINYLLQRLEAYPGMTILTTNHADSLDEALARRIQFKVTFDIPSQSERADLWRILLPEAARDPEIDFDRLGEGFEMSGGHIKNATFRACIRAASLGTTVTTDMLWDAAVLEFRSMGHVIRDDIDLDEA